MNSTIIMIHVFSNGVLVGRLVIGIYYGFLSTLPLAPSHLVSIRALLLEDENEQTRTTGRPAVKGIFIAGFSGFMLAQCTMFLSIYYPPLYVAWFKPHVLSLLLAPALVFHCSRIFHFELIPLTHFGHPLLHPKMQITFWESFIFQLLNPFVLPNPVFSRLMSIYLFRYSDIPLLIAGNLLGWFTGQILFIGLSYYLLVRFQKDSPTIYSITKRVIHWAFAPLMLVIIACSTGVMPLTHAAYKIQKKKFNKLIVC
jgi:Ycf1